MIKVKSEFKEEPSDSEDDTLIHLKERTSTIRVKPEFRDQDSDEDSSEAPPKKRKLTALTLGEKQMIYNVSKYVEESEDTQVLSNLYNKVAAVLDISVTNVYEVLKEYAETGTLSGTYVCKPTSAISTDHLTGIRQRIHRFYLKGEVPTFAKVLEDLNSDEPIYQKEGLKKILKQMKFKTIKGSNMRAIVEKDEYVLQRIAFLRNIKTLREEGRNIFYLAEIFIPVGAPPAAEEKKKGAKKTKAASQASKNQIGLILAHIGSSAGFVAECQLLIETDGSKKVESLRADQFEAWLKDVLPKLGEKAVIVMGNEKHHRRLTERLPSLFWPKVDIQKWLKSKGIEYEQDEFKVELVERVRKVKDQYKIYAVDVMAHNFGAEVLRLPPYHAELNALDMIFAEIKQGVTKDATTKKVDKVKESLDTQIKMITDKTWKKHTNKVIKEEEVLSKLDHAIDDIIDTQVLDDVRVEDTEYQAGYNSDSSMSFSDDDEILGS